MARPYLGNPGKCREVLKKYGFAFRKKYGQNFLISETVLMGILDAAGISKEDFVLEIGPGIGTLTQYLASAARRVTAVEIDRSLLPILSDTLADWPNADVINGDILKTDISAIAARENEGRPIKIAANLPYYITTPIIMGLLEGGAPIESLTVMVQKEVAERMVTGPGSKEYGALSLAAAYYTEAEIAFIVPPEAFIPQPKVESAVVHMTLRTTPPVTVREEALLFALIRAAFNERRKTLVNGISHYAGFHFSKEEAAQAVAACGFDPRVRGEALTLADFAAVADALYDIRENRNPDATFERDGGAKGRSLPPLPEPIED